jgi:DNA polymerase III delta prime subunit
VPSDRFIGRPEVLERLRRARDAGKLGQPFLLVGPEGAGKENTALEFARELNCAAPGSCGPGALCESCVKALGFQHPDIRWIGPAPAAIGEDEVRALLEQKIANPFLQTAYASNSQIGIGDVEHPGPLTVRSIIHFLRRRAFQGRFKVAVVADGQRLNAAAANAFLKTLEEPPPDTVIFLLTTGTEGMLPTILSRCQKIRFEPWPEDQLVTLLTDLGGADRAAAQEAARTAEGNARRGMALLDPAARLVTDWAVALFGWIHAGERGQAAIAADELHRGLVGHACLPAGVTAKSLEVKDPAQRRDRAIQLCERLNLLYSDAMTSLEVGDAWRPRIAQAAETVARCAAGRRTESLLAGMASLDAARGDLERNLNIGLAMAVLFEGLIDHVEADHAAGRIRG